MQPYIQFIRCSRCSIRNRACLGYLSRIRNMARAVAKIFVAEREKLGFPLLNKTQQIQKP